jgi:mortality factor 4-like protein 1
MPELIAQTNMDAQGVNKLREELLRMMIWMTRNAARIFATPYEKAAPDYLAAHKP